KSSPARTRRAGAGKAAASETAEGSGSAKTARRSKKASPAENTTSKGSTGERRRSGKSASDRPRGRSRELLLEAASRLLSQRNSIDVSLSEIAQESGLNSALISYHFGNKEGLLLALVRRDAETAMRQLDQLLAMDISPEQKIRLHIRGVISTYAKYP